MVENGEKINLGHEKIKPHLREGEVFVGNADLPTEGEFNDGDASRVVHGLMQSGRYESARWISVAYDIDGNYLSYMAAVVAKPKSNS